MPVVHERSVDRPVSTHPDCPLPLSLSYAEELGVASEEESPKKLHASVFSNAWTLESFLDRRAVPRNCELVGGSLLYCNITPNLSISSADTFPKHIV